MTQKSDQLLVQILSEFRSASVEMAALRTEMRNLKDTLETISGIVHGNGKPSILTSVAVVEAQIDHMKTRIDAGHQEIRNISEQFESSRKAKAVVVAALISGLLGFLGSAIALLKN